MASDPVDLPELRRLAEAAGETALPWAPPFSIHESLYLSAASPRVVLALLDRIDALEAEVRQALAQRDGLDAGYAEAGRLLRRIIREQCGSDFVDPEVGGAFAVCAGMDAVELAAWLGAELREPGSADPGAVAGEPESEETTR